MNTDGKFRNLFMYFFIIVLCVLLIANLYRACTGVSYLTFQSFLDCFSTMPNITVNSYIDLSIGGDWGIFEFLRNFINTLSSITSVALYFSSLIIQVIITIAWFVAWFFGFI